MALIVIDAGLSTTVQDEGRPGYREWGVPLQGCVRPRRPIWLMPSLGNPPAAPVLRFHFLRRGVSAGRLFNASGAWRSRSLWRARVLQPNSTEHSLQLPSSFSLRAGERLSLGRNLGGARSYLAVKAGWQMKVQLGSRSSEKRLQSGDVLPAESGTIPTRRFGEPPWRSPTDEPFRLIAGPDGLSHAELDDAFWSVRRFRVGSQGNRIGLRLQGDPVSVTSQPGRLSTPVAPGAIQVAGGQLIVLGVACGTMGGYPHVAHVISADLDRLGQLRPGDTLTFCLVTLDEARALDRAARQARGVLLHRLATLVDGA